MVRQRVSGLESGVESCEGRYFVGVDVHKKSYSVTLRTEERIIKRWSTTASPRQARADPAEPRSGCRHFPGLRGGSDGFRPCQVCSRRRRRGRGGGSEQGVAPGESAVQNGSSGQRQAGRFAGAGAAEIHCHSDPGAGTAAQRHPATTAVGQGNPARQAAHQVVPAPARHRRTPGTVALVQRIRAGLGGPASARGIAPGFGLPTAGPGHAGRRTGSSGPRIERHP